MKEPGQPPRKESVGTAPSVSSHPARIAASNGIRVSLLTGGSDRPYVWGIATELLAKGAAVDLIGSDELDFPEFRNRPQLNFLKLRGDQSPDAGLIQKALRISAYYAKLVRYAATAKPKIFHILWNNRFEIVDRTVLMLYYKALGKKVVLTAHNVNTAKRDGTDTLVNRVTLKIQYRLADHVFVHTEKMKSDLIVEFSLDESRVSVIPFGINNSIPATDLAPFQAKDRLGLRQHERVLLFFGRISPYKGLEYLNEAFRLLSAQRTDYRLLIAGRVDAASGEKYWKAVRTVIQDDIRDAKVLTRTEYIPDDETEIYFKAADVLILPYKDIYQSGVLFLAHSFGLPVIAADVGSLKEDIIEGSTGYLFKSEDPADLARVIDRYFESDLFKDLGNRRNQIRKFATERHSWSVVGQRTTSVYESLLRPARRGARPSRDPSKSSLDVNAPF